MRILAAICMLAVMSSVALAETTDRLEKLISDYVSDKDARIGVAVITDDGDTIEVNGRERFPMMSVFKFPVALAVGNSGVALDSVIAIGPEDLLPDTYSPMRDRIGRRDTAMTVNSLLEYSLKMSDNNACDVLLRISGGPAATDSLMKALGYADIAVGATEADMHARPDDVMLNTSTPLAMASLMMDFASDISHRSDFNKAIASMMETCSTGTDRLAAPLAESGATIGHKTGTGDTDSSGRISALNDAGYVILPSGRKYAIAVFIADSGMDMARTSATIAAISEIVMRHMAEIWI